MLAKRLIFFGALAVPIFGMNTARANEACDALSSALQASIETSPRQLLTLVESAVRSNPDCASSLVRAAIIGSTADEKQVADIVRTAVSQARGQAVKIAETAMNAAPTASDAVAGVVEEVLGDCNSYAEDVAAAVQKNPERILVVVEDALRANENCACEIVKSAIEASEAGPSIVKQIVRAAVEAAPTKAAAISECATIASPGSVAAIESAMTEALGSAERGPGSIAAATRSDLVVEEGLSLAEAELGDLDSNLENYDRAIAQPVASQVDIAPQAGPNRGASASYSYGKGNGQISTGKGYSYGKGYNYGKQPLPPTPEPTPPMDWGGPTSSGFAPVYLIAPITGATIPRVSVSPSDPAPTTKPPTGTEGTDVPKPE